jgi:hypothetical protein
MIHTELWNWLYARGPDSFAFKISATGHRIPFPGMAPEHHLQKCWSPLEPLAAGVALFAARLFHRPALRLTRVSTDRPISVVGGLLNIKCRGPARVSPGPDRSSRRRYPCSKGRPWGESHLAKPETSVTRVAATRDLPTIAFFRAGALLRRSVPVPGILAAHRPGATMDKSGRHFVARSGLGDGPPPWSPDETSISKDMSFYFLDRKFQSPSP